MAHRILIVEDEPKIVRLLVSYLERSGYETRHAPDGPSAVASFREQPVDLIILDLHLPGMDGFDVTREIRKQSETPILMLTARSEASDKLIGLELGADDYVTKPFNPKEVVARVRAILRRSAAAGGAGAGAAAAADDRPGPGSGSIIEVQDLRIEPGSYRVYQGDREVPLTAYQFELLLKLASNPGRVFTRGQLVEAVQGQEYEGYERTVDAHIKNLRRALRDDPEEPRYISTVRGIGYRFEEGRSAGAS